MGYQGGYMGTKEELAKEIHNKKNNFSQRKFSMPELGNLESSCAELINNILLKFSKLNEDSIIDKILSGKEEYDLVCETITAILKWKRLNYVLAFHEELIAFFLVGTAKYHYNDSEGGFWNQVEKIIRGANLNSRRDIVNAFYRVVKKYNLPLFEDEKKEGYKLIAPIVCHAGIPQNCIDSWFDAIYQMQKVKYSNLELELNFACRYADRPVKRYIKFLSERGLVAEEVQQIQELISCVIAKKAVPESIDLSCEVKKYAVDWAETKGKACNSVFIKRFSPELLYDCETYNLTVHLPDMNLKKGYWVRWDIISDEEILRKKIYGKEQKDGYFYKDCEILIKPAKTITVKLFDDSGIQLDEFCLKRENEVLVFNNKGRLNKSKYLSKSQSYFICEKDIEVCNDLQILYEYEEFTAYIFNSDKAKEVWLKNNDKRIEYTVKQIPELERGRILFGNNADFEYIDVYSELPYMTMPYNGEWEFLVSFGRDLKKYGIFDMQNEISIERIIYDLFGKVEYGIYSIRTKHAKCGYSSFKFAYFPYCSMRRTGFFPKENGYESSQLKFTCENGAYVTDLNDEKVSDLKTIADENIFSGNICYKDLKIPFNVQLKAFKWEIFNQEKSFGADNKTSYISSGDIKDSEWVMINIRNFTDTAYCVEVNCGNDYQKIYQLGANRKISLNLKEFVERIDSSKETFTAIAIIVDEKIKHNICLIKKKIQIKKLCGKHLDKDKILLWWEENGSLRDRELVISNLLLPYKQKILEIEDGICNVQIDKSIFSPKAGYVIFVRNREVRRQSIYGDIAEKPSIDRVCKINYNCKYDVGFSMEMIEDILMQNKPDIKQCLYSYIFLFLNLDKDVPFKKIILNAYRERIILLRVQKGDAEFYNALFGFDLDLKIWDYVFKCFALAMPCFNTETVLDNEEVLKDKNLIAYIQYLYRTSQDTKLRQIKAELNNVQDKESFTLSKANLIFPHCYEDKELMTMIKGWRSVLVNSKWLSESEALAYSMCEIIEDDLNKRLNRVNARYSNAVYNLATKYAKSFSQIYCDYMIGKKGVKKLWH